MLIYSAHLPHSPALLPHLAGKRAREFRKTRLAIAAVASDLGARQVETIVFITPHGPGDHHYFTVNFAPRYRVDFAKFGDLATRDEFSGDSELTLILSEQLRRHPQPIKIVTREKLDTAAAAAVLLLTKPALLPVSKKRLKDSNIASVKNLPVLNYKILPIIYALLPPEALISFGRALREAIEQNHKRIALISLGDLSHAGKKTAAAENTDKSVIKNLKARDLPALAGIGEGEIKSLSLAGFRALLVNLGALQDTNYQTEILSYEQKFGVGLLTARFVF